MQGHDFKEKNGRTYKDLLTARLREFLVPGVIACLPQNQTFARCIVEPIEHTSTQGRGNKEIEAEYDHVFREDTSEDVVAIYRVIPTNAGDRAQLSHFFQAIFDYANTIAEPLYAEFEAKGISRSELLSAVMRTTFSSLSGASFGAVEDERVLNPGVAMLAINAFNQYLTAMTNTAIVYGFDSEQVHLCLLDDIDTLAVPEGENIVTRSQLYFLSLPKSIEEFCRQEDFNGWVRRIVTKVLTVTVQTYFEDLKVFYAQTMPAFRQSHCAKLFRDRENRQNPLNLAERLLVLRELQRRLHFYQGNLSISPEIIDGNIRALRINCSTSQAIVNFLGAASDDEIIVPELRRELSVGVYDGAISAAPRELIVSNVYGILDLAGIDFQNANIVSVNEPNPNRVDLKLTDIVKDLRWYLQTFVARYSDTETFQRIRRVLAATNINPQVKLKLVGAIAAEHVDYHCSVKRSLGLFGRRNDIYHALAKLVDINFADEKSNPNAAADKIVFEVKAVKESHNKMLIGSEGVASKNDQDRIERELRVKRMQARTQHGVGETTQAFVARELLPRIQHMLTFGESISAASLLRPEYLFGPVAKLRNFPTDLQRLDEKSFGEAVRILWALVQQVGAFLSTLPADAEEQLAVKSSRYEAVLMAVLAAVQSSQGERISPWITELTKELLHNNYLARQPVSNDELLMNVLYNLQENYEPNLKARVKVLARRDQRTGLLLGEQYSSAAILGRRTGVTHDTEIGRVSEGANDMATSTVLDVERNWQRIKKSKGDTKRNALLAMARTDPLRGLKFFANQKKCEKDVRRFLRLIHDDPVAHARLLAQVEDDQRYDRYADMNFRVDVYPSLRRAHVLKKFGLWRRRTDTANAMVQVFRAFDRFDGENKVLGALLTTIAAGKQQVECALRSSEVSAEMAKMAKGDFSTFYPDLGEAAQVTARHEGAGQGGESEALPLLINNASEMARVAQEARSLFRFVDNHDLRAEMLPKLEANEAGLDGDSRVAMIEVFRQLEGSAYENDQAVLMYLLQQVAQQRAEVVPRSRRRAQSALTLKRYADYQPDNEHQALEAIAGGNFGAFLPVDPDGSYDSGIFGVS